MRNIIAILTLLSLCLFACSESTTESGTEEFTNTLWQLESFEISGVNIKPPADQIYQLQFLANDSLHGINDCNTMYGSYKKQNDNKLMVTEFGGTKLGCGNDSMDDQFMEAILNTNSYNIDQDILYINYSTNSRLRFISR